MHSLVETVRTFRLVLNFRFILDFENTFYAPSFSSNLVFVFKLTNVDFDFHFEDSVVKFLKIKILFALIF